MTPDTATVYAIPVGSRVTCDPPPTDTDEDWLIYCDDYDEATHGEYAGGSTAAGRVLGKAGFHTPDGAYIADESSLSETIFQSWTKKIGDRVVNVILAFEDDFARRFVAATSIAKRLNLTNKADRVALFQAVLYGNPCDGFPSDLDDFRVQRGCLGYRSEPKAGSRYVGLETLIGEFSVSATPTS